MIPPPPPPLFSRLDWPEVYGNHHYQFFQILYPPVSSRPCWPLSCRPSRTSHSAAWPTTATAAPTTPADTLSLDTTRYQSAPPWNTTVSSFGSPTDPVSHPTDSFKPSTLPPAPVSTFPAPALRARSDRRTVTSYANATDNVKRRSTSRQFERKTWSEELHYYWNEGFWKEEGQCVKEASWSHGIAVSKRGGAGICIAVDTTTKTTTTKDRRCTSGIERE